MPMSSVSNICHKCNEKGNVTEYDIDMRGREVVENPILCETCRNEIIKDELTYLVFKRFEDRLSERDKDELKQLVDLNYNQRENFPPNICDDCYEYIEVAVEMIKRQTKDSFLTEEFLFEYEIDDFERNYLFSLDKSEYQQYLEEGLMDSELEDAFRDHGERTLIYPKLSVDNGIWSVINKPSDRVPMREYLIEVTTSELKVYDLEYPSKYAGVKSMSLRNIGRGRPHTMSNNNIFRKQFENHGYEMSSKAYIKKTWNNNKTRNNRRHAIFDGPSKKTPNYWVKKKIKLNGLPKFKVYEFSDVEDILDSIEKELYQKISELCDDCRDSLFKNGLKYWLVSERSNDLGEIKPAGENDNGIIY